MIVKIKRFLMKDENVKKEYILKRKTDPKMLNFWYKSIFLLGLYLKNIFKYKKYTSINAENIYFENGYFNIVLNYVIDSSYSLVLKSKNKEINIKSSIKTKGKAKTRIVISMKNINISDLESNSELMIQIDNKLYSIFSNINSYIHKSTDIYKQDDFRYSFIVTKNNKINFIISKNKFIYNTILINNDFNHGLDEIIETKKINEKWTIISASINLKDLVTGKIDDVYASVLNKKNHEYALAHLKKNMVEYKQYQIRG